ncbi:uncharacterized protein LOC131665216 [Phymastichus coffea]|uniref:uncharacterized protein LOC131665216 n=1 Tax=Phymastichus coffea TaxID=108790 RepID=UPI00273A8591|nr:uncharacterized protein LOC131665216 [Phymastichus coffea]
MSQHPSRGPPYGGSSGWSPAGRPTALSPFRPASPYSPTPMPYQQQQRAPQVYHPLSPVPIGVPISPGISPVLGGSTPTSIQCPSPRWPSPGMPGNTTPRPYFPQPQSPLSYECMSPQPCGPPEYLIAPYRSGEYEYVGVPLDPGPDDEDSGPSTAEIIASQSQDYVDEKLAEYQATILQLQVIDLIYW